MIFPMFFSTLSKNYPQKGLIPLNLLLKCNLSISSLGTNQKIAQTGKTEYMVKIAKTYRYG